MPLMASQQILYHHVRAYMNNIVIFNLNEQNKRSQKELIVKKQSRCYDQCVGIKALRYSTTVLFLYECHRFSMFLRLVCACHHAMHNSLNLLKCYDQQLVLSEGDEVWDVAGLPSACSKFSTEKYVRKIRCRTIRWPPRRLIFSGVTMWYCTFFYCFEFNVEYFVKWTPFSA